jgi:hypothetical protein
VIGWGAELHGGQARGGNANGEEREGADGWLTGATKRETEVHHRSSAVGKKLVIREGSVLIEGARVGRGWPVGPPLHSVAWYLFKWFSYGSIFELVKDGPLVLEKFEIKCGCADIEIRNTFPHWIFSKFKAEFELKFREPKCVKFDWIWILGTWKLQNLLEFDM